MNRSGTIPTLVLALFLAGSVQAKTCDDVEQEWLQRPELGSEQRVGHSEPTQSNSIVVVSEVNRKKAYLVCTGAVSLDFPAQAASEGAAGRAGAFKVRVGEAWRSKSLPAGRLRQAIYLHQLGSRHPLQSTDVSAEWDLGQAHAWCWSKQPRAWDATVPSDLPTLQMGVDNLDPQAITLAWKVVQTWPSKDLANGCDAAARELARAAD